MTEPPFDDAAAYTTISYEVDDGVLLLRLDRPDRMNAFTVTMSRELVHAFDRASGDDTVRAVVVTGSGKAFCAGMDLGEENVFGLNHALQPTNDDMRARLEAPDIAEGVRDTGGLVALSIYRCLKPVIAAINGVAVGIGATMTLAMDFRLLSSEAKMGFVFGRLGIVPEACSSWFLPRLVGMSQALEWTYRADLFGAQDALDKGLARSVHAPATLLDDACAFARSLVEGRSAVGIALTRQMMWRNSNCPSPLDAHRVDSLAVFYTSREDGREGVAAFREKRAANFTSKASAMPSFFPWPEA